MQTDKTHGYWLPKQQIKKRDSLLVVPFFLLGEIERTDLSILSVPNGLCLVRPPPPNAPQHQKNCLKPRLNLGKGEQTL